MLSRGFPSIMVIVSQLIGALFFLSRLDSRLAGAILFIMSGALLLSKSYIKRCADFPVIYVLWTAGYKAIFREYLQHCILVRTLGNTLRAGNTLASLQLNFTASGNATYGLLPFFPYGSANRFFCRIYDSFLMGSFGLQNGTVTFGVMAAFLQLVAQIQGPLVELSRQIPAFIHLITSSNVLLKSQFYLLEQQGKSIMLDGIPGIRVESLDFFPTPMVRKRC